jgi:hypothetical protein
MLIGLAGLVWRGFERLGSRMDRLETRLDGRIDGLGSRIETLTSEVHKLGLDVAEIRGTLGFPARQAK